eukprot:GDKJ01062963.1.p1 GENE.GDKJ01062963.1~~GDKJ01062963.1.p1  ORF type:complete len:1104 (-),score=124.59 GDKJ01062963.1:646-3957(-)
MGNNYELLLNKINEFTRKFYLHKLLRGSIYAAAIILALYLFLFVYVYYAYPSITTKTILFFSFLIIALAALAFWVVKPALAYFKLSKTISLEEAAILIGNHFFNVKDRLLNTLQLKAIANEGAQQNALVLAGIDQKIMELKPIPFANAINLGENKAHIKYLLVPLAVIISIAILAPAILKEGTNSLVKYNEEVLPKAPFNFNIVNKNLRVTQGDDLTLEVALTGDQFPQDIYVEDGKNAYKLNKQDIGHFSYTFKSIQQRKTIRLSGGGFNSSTFTIDVVPRPSLLQINATLVYPKYLNRKTESVPNVGDLLIPEGTKVNWTLHTANSKQVDFILLNQLFTIPVTNQIANISHNIRQGGSYKVTPKNGFVSNADSLSHQIAVIADQYPTINVTETPDSLSTKALYFSGSIADDYGFSSLKFRYNITQGGKIVGSLSKTIAIKTNQTTHSFFFLWDLNTVDVKPGQILTYYFEVADNDGVNGAKTTKSAVQTYQVPTQQQITAKLSAGSEALKQKMEATIKLAASIEKESKKLSQNLVDKKQLTYEDKKQIEQLLDKQKQLNEAVKDIKNQNEKNTFEKQENNALNDELKNKQKQIDDLFNNVLDEKTKDLLQKLQQLMELNNKDQARENLSKMQMDNKGLKNELDRILELYKQLEFEQNLQNNIDRLNDLAKQQKELVQQSKDNKTPANDIANKQEELNKALKDLQKELEKLAQKDEQLEKPNNFEAPKKELEQIKQKQQDSKDQLSKNNKQKAAQQQQEAAEQMEQLAQQMQQEQQEGEEQEQKVNAQELRKLLENLLSTSFAQEKVMLALRRMSANDPAYTANVQQQNTVKDNMKTIADSLFSLSKRVPQIESTVNTEVDKINFNIEKAIGFLGDRRTAEANRNQQFAMTSLNNLALMLNEALEQLQKSMKNSGKGKGQKQNMQQLQKMQEQLNQRMQNAREKMQQEGNMGKVAKNNMSEEFAKMAQQQQMIRDALQKINKEENKDGKGSLGNLNQLIDDMKKTEMDLVNKRIADETMNRQKNLSIKLLDADKAQREQDEDSKRESAAAKQFPPSYQQMLEKFKKQQQSETELLQKLPPNLNYYYKNKIADYFKLLNSPNK